MPHQFLLHMLKCPFSTGALFPSSPFLSRAMAQASKGASRLIELGAGTGPVTRALLELHAPDCPDVVELQPDLAANLAKRFPFLAIQAVPAHEVLDTYGHSDADVALVSSLPFRSLPADVWILRNQ